MHYLEPRLSHNSAFRNKINIDMILGYYSILRCDGLLSVYLHELLLRRPSTVICLIDVVKYGRSVGC